ncbi:MAG: helix-turn-helix transcriptional regulator [Leptospirales bacterium]
MLTQKEMEQVLSLIALVYEASDRRSLFCLITEGLPDLFGNSSSIFIPIEPKTGNMLFSEHHIYQHHAKVLLQYILYYAPLSPLVMSGWIRETASAVALYSDIVSYPLFEESEYMRDFMSQIPMYYCLGIKFFWKGEILGILGIHRTKELGDFGPRERMIGELLAPHFSNALHRILIQESLHPLSDPETAVMLVDSGGNTIYSNANARRILESAPLERIQDIEMETIPTFFRTKWGVYRLRGFFLDAESQKILSREMGGFRDRRSRKGVRVILMEPFSEGVLNRKKISEHGLTPRQQEVVSKVTQGYSNRVIAESLGISEQTVKDHLHDIFEKLRLRSRCELILYFGEKPIKLTGPDP